MREDFVPGSVWCYEGWYMFVVLTSDLVLCLADDSSNRLVRRTGSDVGGTFLLQHNKVLLESMRLV